MPTPFNRRPLIPLLARGSTYAWQVITGGSLILTGPALAWWLTLNGLTTTQVLYGVLAYTSLWGVFGLLAMCPVLIDAPSTLLGLLGACYYLQAGDPIGLLIMGLIAGTIKEQGPVFMALYAWHPLPLIGLLFTAYAMYRGAPTPEPPLLRFALHHPFHHAREFRDRRTFHVEMVAPWGLLLLLALLHPTPYLWVVLAVAYGQMVMASDVSRLYQQAFPVVILCALQAPIDAIWWPLITVAQLINPWQKTEFEAQPIPLSAITEGNPSART